MALRALVVVLCLAGLSVARAQAPSAADNLAAGIRLIAADDAFRALLTLNEAAGQLTTPRDSELLARVHAYRVMALLKLDQPERARAAVGLALAANPGLSPAATEFNPAVVALFDEGRRPGAPIPPDAGKTATQPGRFPITSPEPPPAVAPMVPRPLGPATIYIYWPEQQRGGGRQKVSCNGKQVAELQNNRYVILKAAPGSHDLAFRDKHVTVVAEAGREYYFRTSIEGQWRFAMGPEIRLTVVDAARTEMQQQGMAVNDARRTLSTECVVPTPNRRTP